MLLSSVTFCGWDKNFLEKEVCDDVLKVRVFFLLLQNLAFSCVTQQYCGSEVPDFPETSTIMELDKRMRTSLSQS